MDAGILMYGCLCVVASVGMWLFLASYLEMPVSTTHSAVGGMVGMTIITKGTNVSPNPPARSYPRTDPLFFWSLPHALCVFPAHFSRLLMSSSISSARPSPPSRACSA